MSNPMEYEFNFQLEIRGPCLLAGERSYLDPDRAGKKIPDPGVGRGREGTRVNSLGGQSGPSGSHGEGGRLFTGRRP